MICSLFPPHHLAAPHLATPDHPGTLAAGGPALSFALIGRKGPPAVTMDGSAAHTTPPPLFDGPPSAPLRIAPVTSVYLNNMECIPLGDLTRFARVGGF